MMNKIKYFFIGWLEDHLMSIPAVLMVLLLLLMGPLEGYLPTNENQEIYDGIMIILFISTMGMMGVILIIKKRLGFFAGRILVVLGWIMLIWSIALIVWLLYLHRFAFFGLR
jgi:hypothetical protein